MLMALKRIRKFQDGRTVWMKNKDNVWAYRMTIVEAEHDTVRNTWSYLLKNDKDEVQGSFVAETRLKAG